MNTRVDYGQLAAKLDYNALNKKLEQLSQREPPKKRKTVVDALEPLRERLMALHRKGWSSGQLVEELKAAGIPVSPARMRECLGRWSGHGNWRAKSRPPPSKIRQPRGQAVHGVTSQWKPEALLATARVDSNSPGELQSASNHETTSCRKLAGPCCQAALPDWPSSCQHAPASPGRTAPGGCPWLRAAGTIRPALLATDSAN